MKFLKVCLIALAAGMSLCAGDPQFAFGVNAISATGDAKPLLGSGFGLDVGSCFDIGSQETGRFRVSYGSFGAGSEKDVHGQSLDGKATTLTLGLDFLLPFGSREAKGYALLGVGLAHGSFEFTSYGYVGGSTTPASTTQISESDMGVMLGAGLGYRFTDHFGLELRYEKLSFATDSHFLPGTLPVDVGGDHFALGCQVRY